MEDEDGKITYIIPLAGFDREEMEINWEEGKKRNRVIVKCHRDQKDETGRRDVVASLKLPVGFNRDDHFVEDSLNNDTNSLHAIIKRPPKPESGAFSLRSFFPKSSSSSEDLKRGCVYEISPFITVTEYDGEIYFIVPLHGYNDDSLEVWTAGPRTVEVREAGVKPFKGPVKATLTVPRPDKKDREQADFHREHVGQGMYVVTMKNYPNPSLKVV